MTKVPFAESRRLLIVMESPSVIRKGRKKRNSKRWKALERNHSRNAAHVHGWDDYERQVRAV